MKCRLKVILAEKGLKSKWLAEKAGIQNATLSRIINGKTIPTLDVAFRIAEALGMSIHDIWERE
ncbi:transcriptional regulator [Effusibacillus lacus]|uniref:Transcriptional regulator n=1 Tax=Effusibacillus lacus TaxID=1348429 RepID=A0A292YR79_9BACL|nr:helix-turn-helix transcriptional regulator [Effusibacillus lacus]TCS76934.1 DNA-binding XRE family transcriptional regulator [Effusibacillus lacus]GAX91263.1 transcriptional regulator [Effusibacillus lacus]